MREEICGYCLGRRFIDAIFRDFNVGLAKKGLLCIEKKVISEDGFLPIGVEGADGPLVSVGPKGKYIPNYTSHFLFRRIEPRT